MAHTSSLMNTTLIKCLSLAAIAAVQPLLAQDRFVPEVAATHPAAVRMDHVRADLRTPAQAGDRTCFSRSVETGPDGLYHVRIRSAQRIQRMEGCFLDSSLSVPHGRFIYYHPNGRIESVGEYEHGVKVGTWYAQDVTGHGRAERTYAGQAPEDLLLAVGVHHRARMLEDH